MHPRALTLGFALVAIAYLMWTRLGLGGPIGFITLAEAAGFATLAWAAWAPGRTAALRAGASVVLVAEIAFFAAFSGAPDLTFQALNLVGLAGGALLALGAWRGADLPSLRPGAAVMGGILGVSVLLDMAAGSTLLLEGYVFAVPGWAAVGLALWRPAAQPRARAGAAAR